MQDALSPMMQQYQRLRKSIPPDTLLLFRLGDFYEMFFDDAKEASALLNVALTKRNGVPMCGVPYHAAPGYIRRLINTGRRVAVCDQMSEPQPGRKIVDREVTQIISAGTVSELSWLDAKRANYLGAVYADAGVFGFAYTALSTGKFHIARTFQGPIARRLWLRPDACRCVCSGGYRALLEASTATENRPHHLFTL